VHERHVARQRLQERHAHSRQSTFPEAALQHGGRGNAGAIGSMPMLAPGPGFFGDPANGRDLVRLAAVYEPDRLISNSEQILGRSATGPTIAERLYATREGPPTDLKKIFTNRFLKVYEVAP
jgi:hypothetical protein